MPKPQRAKHLAKKSNGGGSSEGLPTTEVPAAELIDMGILAACVTAGLASSNGDARRHIKGGALKLNDIKINSHERALGEADINDGVIKISVGKKKHALLKAV